MVQAEVRACEEERQMARGVEQRSQSAWTQWDLPESKISWQKLWQLEPYQMSFLLRSVYDTLPSPAHLHVLGLRKIRTASSVGKRGHERCRKMQEACLYRLEEGNHLCQGGSKALFN